MQIHTKSLLTRVVVVLLLTLAMLNQPCLGQNSPEYFVSAHNAARAEVGVGPVVWDEGVAEYALGVADACARTCSPHHSINLILGENLGFGTDDFGDRDAMAEWLSEKPFYKSDTNECVGGECGHYTQIVWRTSVRIGCARSQCNRYKFVACAYEPKGNIINERPC